MVLAGCFAIILLCLPSVDRARLVDVSVGVFRFKMIRLDWVDFIDSYYCIFNYPAGGLEGDDGNRELGSEPQQHALSTHKHSHTHPNTFLLLHTMSLVSPTLRSSAAAGRRRRRSGRCGSLPQPVQVQVARQHRAHVVGEAQRVEQRQQRQQRHIHRIGEPRLDRNGIVGEAPVSARRVVDDEDLRVEPGM